MKLHHVAVVCRSLENADQFFEGILGLKKIKTSTLQKELVARLFNRDVECRLNFYSGHGIAIEAFVTDSVERGKMPFVHLCLEVEDRETFLKNCQAAGLPVNRVSKGDSTVVFVEDFDKNLYEVKESYN